MTSNKSTSAPVISDSQIQTIANNLDDQKKDSETPTVVKWQRMQITQERSYC